MAMFSEGVESVWGPKLKKKGTLFSKLVFITLPITELNRESMGHVFKTVLERLHVPKKVEHLQHVSRSSEMQYMGPNFDLFKKTNGKLTYLS